MDKTALEAALEGMPLPARRDEIVEYAEIEGGEDDLLTALRALDDREYETVDEIGGAVEAVEA